MAGEAPGCSRAWAGHRPTCSSPGWFPLVTTAQAVRQAEHLALLKLNDAKQKEEHKKQTDNLKRMLQASARVHRLSAGSRGSRCPMVLVHRGSV